MSSSCLARHAAVWSEKRKDLNANDCRFGLEDTDGSSHLVKSGSAVCLHCRGSPLRCTVAGDGFRVRGRATSTPVSRVQTADVVVTAHCTRPRYSIRRQKTLARALNAVQLESSEASTWILPTSSKVQAEATNRSRLQQKVEDYLKEYADTNVQGTEIALTQGPYKGRTQKPLKLHKWEREAESIKKSRQEKLKAMPARIADYMKTRAAAKASARPSMPF